MGVIPRDFNGSDPNFQLINAISVASIRTRMNGTRICCEDKSLEVS